MKKDDLEELFNGLDGTLDIENPAEGHQQRFLRKLNAAEGITVMDKKKINWWKPISIAASIAIICGWAFSQLGNNQSIDEQVAEISPEVGQTQFYFASLIEEQVKELKKESTPETEKIISDTLIQLKSLETDYTDLKRELLKGGNSKLILSAMVVNFQIRIDLLNDVLGQIETIKNIKNYNDANFTI
ncbi:hypothetical protein [Maribacter sp. 2304DJ31-5]|uniref:hypothetical protein n=1 Tax=Maribacter sp. 2304DJ31-5 TaxID=3386273 RepID=UPI0039BD7369